MWKFLAGLALGAATGFGFYALERNDPIRHGAAEVNNWGDAVEVKGALLIDGQEVSEDWLHWGCDKSSMTCAAASVSGLHNRTMMPMPSTVRAVKWNDRELIISNKDDHPEQCRYYEVRADLLAEKATYVSLPSTNTGKCKSASQDVESGHLVDGM